MVEREPLFQELQEQDSNRESKDVGFTEFLKQNKKWIAKRFIMWLIGGTIIFIISFLNYYPQFTFGIVISFANTAYVLFLVAVFSILSKFMFNTQVFTTPLEWLDSNPSRTVEEVNFGLSRPRIYIGEIIGILTALFLYLVGIISLILIGEITIS